MRRRFARLERSTLLNKGSTHAGLWADKFLSSTSTEDTTARSTLVGEVAGIQESPLYREFFQRWQASLGACGAVCRKARVQGRMIVGLGGESVWENTIRLHRAYGVPYIPGSALKGLAAHYARNRLQDDRWRKDGAAYETLFGNTGAAGYVTFFDALYVPGSAPGGRPLRPDVIAVHHPGYYRGEGKPPADWDSPIPVSFLSATGAYLLALAGPDDWVAAAYQILALALEEEGIGAKTSSGYGRMVLQ